jgi:hypothetical protein
MIIDLEQGISIAQRSLYRTFVGADTEGVSTRELMREQAMHPSMSDVTYCDWGEGIDLAKDGPDIEVVTELIETRKPDVVMIDPVYKLFLGRNVNEQEELGAFISAIDKLRQKHQFAIILPMHPRKPPSQGGSFDMHSLYGNAIWSWWAETILMIKRGEGNETKLQFEKDRPGDLLNRAPWNLTYDIAKGFRKLPGPGGEDDEPRNWTDRVWQLVRKDSPRYLSRKEMVMVLNTGLSNIINATNNIEKGHAMGLEKYRGLVMSKEGSANLYAFQPVKPEVRIIEEDE